MCVVLPLFLQLSLAKGDEYKMQNFNISDHSEPKEWEAWSQLVRAQDLNAFAAQQCTKCSQCSQGCCCLSNVGNGQCSTVGACRSIFGTCGACMRGSDCTASSGGCCCGPIEPDAAYCYGCNCTCGSSSKCQNAGGFCY